MKPFLLTTAFTVLLFSFTAKAQTNDRPSSINNAENKQSTFQVDQVTEACKQFDDFTIAEAKETNGQKLPLKKSQVNAWVGPAIIKYWVDDKHGRVYHLSPSPDHIMYNPEGRICKISNIDQYPKIK